MLTEGTRVHLQLFFRNLADACLEAAAAVASMSAAVNEEPAVRRPRKQPKLRQIPRPLEPVSELEKERAASILKKVGCSIAEMGR